MKQPLGERRSVPFAATVRRVLVRLGEEAFVIVFRLAACIFVLVSAWKALDIIVNGAQTREDRELLVLFGLPLLASALVIPILWVGDRVAGERFSNSLPARVLYGGLLLSGLPLAIKCIFGVP